MQNDAPNEDVQKGMLPQRPCFDLQIEGGMHGIVHIAGFEVDPVGRCVEVVDLTKSLYELSSPRR